MYELYVFTLNMTNTDWQNALSSLRDTQSMVITKQLTGMQKQFKQYSTLAKKTETFGPALTVHTNLIFKNNRKETATLYSGRVASKAVTFTVGP